jgi:hypothetical protein
MSGRYRRLLDKVGPTIFHSTSDGQLENIDIQLLAKSMSSIKSLVLESERQRAL